MIRRYGQGIASVLARPSNSDDHADTMDAPLKFKALMD